MMKDKKDIRPLLVKLGVALALSFAGFVYSHLRTKRIGSKNSNPSSSPKSSSCSDLSKINVGGKVGIKDESRSFSATSSSCDASISHENNEDTVQQKVTVDSNGVGLSPTSKHSGDEEGYLLPEFNELVHKDFEIISPTNHRVSPKKEVETPSPFKRMVEKETDQEIMNLRNMVRILRERERNLEIQLLEYYGLKEQETAVMELQNRLKINNMEAKLFNLKIESLQADNQRLEAQVSDSSKVAAELESARAKIKMLKRKIRSDGEQNKEELCSLKQTVANLQEQEVLAIWNYPEVQTKLQRLEELEEESAELRRAHSRLQRENSELMRRLESTQILASSILDSPEDEELKENNHHLKQENDELEKEIERLQANRCADVEELVYLRWLNACLRYELRNCQVPPGKTVARDLSKTLSPKSEMKAKQLILEYANTEGVGEKSLSGMDFDFEGWSSSQDSNLTESCEFADDSSVDNSSVTRTHSKSKSKFITRLKKLVKGKKGHKDKLDYCPLSTDGNSMSFAESGKRESASVASFEDIMGTYTSNSSSAATRPKNLPASQSSMRSSLDIQRSKNFSLEDVRESQRNSDVGSSFGYKRMVLREEGLLSRDNQLDEEDPIAHEKVELIKLAEALKGSQGNVATYKRGSAYSTF